MQGRGIVRIPDDQLNGDGLADIFLGQIEHTAKELLDIVHAVIVIDRSFKSDLAEQADGIAGCQCLREQERRFDVAIIIGGSGVFPVQTEGLRFDILVEGDAIIYVPGAVVGDLRFRRIVRREGILRFQVDGVDLLERRRIVQGHVRRGSQLNDCRYRIRRTDFNRRIGGDAVHGSGLLQLAGIGDRGVREDPAAVPGQIHLQDFTRHHDVFFRRILIELEHPVGIRRVGVQCGVSLVNRCVLDDIRARKGHFRRGFVHAIQTGMLLARRDRLSIGHVLLTEEVNGRFVDISVAAVL